METCKKRNDERPFRAGDMIVFPRCGLEEGHEGPCGPAKLKPRVVEIEVPKPVKSEEK